MKKIRPLISIVLAAVIALSPVCTNTVFANEGEECSSETSYESDSSEDSSGSNESSEEESSSEASYESDPSGDSSGSNESSGEGSGSEASFKSDSSGDSSGSNGSSEKEGSREASYENDSSGDSNDPNESSNEDGGLGNKDESNNREDFSGDSQEGAVCDEVIGEDNKADVTDSESSETGTGSDADKLGSGIEYFTYDSNISNSYQGTSDENGLAVILRGVSESSKEGAFKAINDYISGILSTGKKLTIEGDFVDAEKFSTNQRGYDSNHCWAATASNILWTTGYAQKAINPMTGQPFSSEDEVLAYFSENFTDEVGAPDDGCDWFFYGPEKYGMTGLQGVAQLKNENTQGLLNDYTSYADLINIRDDAEKLGVLMDLASRGMGVLVRGLIRKEDGNYGLSLGAHWATITGAVLDNTDVVVSVFDKIKAIVISDSDNDAYNQGDIQTTDTSEKLAAKKGQDNTYTVYKVFYNNDIGEWLIDQFYGGYGVITHIYSLLDSDKDPGQGGDVDDGSDIDPKDLLNSPVEHYIDGFSNPVTNTVPDKVKDYVDDLNNGKIDVDETTREVYIFVENKAEKTDEKTDENTVRNVVENTVRNIRVFTEEDLNKIENIKALHDYMTENLLPVYLVNNGQVDANKDYPVYINAPETMLYNLMIDDMMLPLTSYKIVSVDGTLSRLVLDKEFLKMLPKGLHTVKISVQTSDIPAVFVINVL